MSKWIFRGTTDEIPRVVANIKRKEGKGQIFREIFKLRAKEALQGGEISAPWTRHEQNGARPGEPSKESLTLGSSLCPNYKNVFKLQTEEHSKNLGRPDKSPSQPKGCCLLLSWKSHLRGVQARILRPQHCLECCGLWAMTKHSSRTPWESAWAACGSPSEVKTWFLRKQSDAREWPLLLGSPSQPQRDHSVCP